MNKDFVFEVSPIGKLAKADIEITQLRKELAEKEAEICKLREGMLMIGDCDCGLTNSTNSKHAKTCSFKLAHEALSTPSSTGYLEQWEKKNYRVSKPDWYKNPTTEQWFECPDDAQILEDLSELNVGHVIELDVCWNGTQKFLVVKIPDAENDDANFELVEGTTLYARKD